MIKKIKNPFID